MINLMLAAAVGTQGQLTNAEKVARVALSIAQTEFGSNSLQMVDAMGYVSGYLAMQGKWSEAEVFSRQCVAIARRIVPPDHPELEQSLWALSGELQAGGKIEEAAQAYRELLAVRRKRYGNQDDRVMETASTLVRLLEPELNEEKASNIAADIPEAWAVLAEDQARRERWPEARTAAAKFLETRPGDPNAYHLLAPLLAQSGDMAAYSALCAEISRLFAGATDPHVADRMAKDCLILARKEADLLIPDALAEAAVTHGLGDPGSLPYFQFCKALAEYRQGRWASATEWAQRAATNANLYASAESHAVLAMAQFQAKQIEAARSALRKCEEIIESKMGRPGSGDLGQDWRDWIIVHALFAEASDMIGTGDGANNKPSKN
jgi:tetratricopeptide (TPR) repeat protein